MKKILAILLLAVSFSLPAVTFAKGETSVQTNYTPETETSLPSAPALDPAIANLTPGVVSSQRNSDADTPQPTTVIVTEEIPGAGCKCMVNDNCTNPTTKKYSCTIKSGFGSVMDLLGGLIKYTSFIIALVGVLMLVYSGIEMSMSGF